MSLTYGLQSARDLFAKLQRDAATLDKEVSSDNFFNFVVTGYSLVDWIEKDPSVSAFGKGRSQPATCREADSSLPRSRLRQQTLHGR
jgi:hypothetical protein